MLINPDRFENRVKEIALKKSTSAASTSATTNGNATDAVASSWKGAGEGGDGDGDPQSESGAVSDGADCLGATVSHPEGGRTPIQQQGSDGQASPSGMPSAEEDAGHAADNNGHRSGDTGAVSRFAASASKLSRNGSGCPREDLSPLKAGGLMWPPSPEVRLHTSVLDLRGEAAGGSSSGLSLKADATSIGAAGAGSSSRSARKIMRAGANGGGFSDCGLGGCRSPSGERAPPRGQGVVAREGEDPPLGPEADPDGEVQGLSLPPPLAMEVEVEEDPLPSTAGEIVGGGRTKDKDRVSSSSLSPPGAAVGSGASSGASSVSRSRSGTRFEALDVEDRRGSSGESRWVRSAATSIRGTRSAENESSNGARSSGSSQPRAAPSHPCSTLTSTSTSMSTFSSLAGSGACAADGGGEAARGRRRRPGPGGAETGTSPWGGSSQATAPLCAGGPPGVEMEMENTIARRAVRRRKNARQSQSQPQACETGKALAVEGVGVGVGEDEDARTRAGDSDEVVGKCSLLTMFDSSGGRASSSSSSRRVVGRRGAAAPAEEDMVDVVAAITASTAGEALGSEGGASEDFEYDGDSDGRGASGGAPASQEWRVPQKPGGRHRSGGGIDRSVLLPAPHSRSRAASTSLRAAVRRGRGSSATEPTQSDAEAHGSVEQAEAENEVNAGSAVGAAPAGASADAGASALAGRTRSRRSQSAGLDGKRDRSSHHPPGPGSGAGAAAVEVPSTTPMGGGSEVADSTAGGGDPLPLPLSPRSSPDGSLDQKGEGERAVDDDNPIPCMLLLDSTKGHRSQEMFKMVRK